eukprot:RCo006979
MDVALARAEALPFSSSSPNAPEEDWASLFQEIFVEDGFLESEVGPGNFDDMLFYVRMPSASEIPRWLCRVLGRSSSAQGGCRTPSKGSKGAYRGEVEVVVRRRGPVAGPPLAPPLGTKWRESFFLNLAVTTQYVVVCSVHSAAESSGGWREAGASRVYALPFSRPPPGAPTDAPHRASYPELCFPVEGCKPPLSDIVVRPGETLAVELFAVFPRPPHLAVSNASTPSAGLSRSSTPSSVFLPPPLGTRVTEAPLSGCAAEDTGVDDSTSQCSIDGLVEPPGRDGRPGPRRPPPLHCLAAALREGEVASEEASHQVRRVAVFGGLASYATLATVLKRRQRLRTKAENVVMSRSQGYGFCEIAISSAAENFAASSASVEQPESPAGSPIMRKVWDTFMRSSTRTSHPPNPDLRVSVVSLRVHVEALVEDLLLTGARKP